MANWDDIDFRRATKRRYVRGILCVAADVLMLWDFLASLTCGTVAHAFWCSGNSMETVQVAGRATFLPQVVIGSLALAMAFRSAVLAKEECAIPQKNPKFSKHHYYSSLPLAFIAVAIAIQIGHATAQVWISVWFALFISVACVTRSGMSFSIAKLEDSGLLREAVAIVGPAKARERLADRIASDADIVGSYETPSYKTGQEFSDEIQKLQKLGADGCVDCIVLALKDEQEVDVSAIVGRLKILPSQLVICDGDVDTSDRAQLSFLGRVPVRVLLKRPINRRSLLIKTLLDKVLALVLLFSLLPIMLIISILISATSRGPAIFRQTREGWCGQHFTMYKFRTMHDAPEAPGRCTQTQRNDPRCTRFGRILRHTSLDELPQLWNVLSGDMALVGPRPHTDTIEHMDRAGHEIVAEYAQRCRVKPGITGWAQVHGSRGATSTVDQLQHRIDFDLYYIEHWSLWLDFLILLRTPLCMVGKNVF